jgi:hypothetical protein
MELPEAYGASAAPTRFQLGDICSLNLVRSGNFRGQRELPSVVTPGGVGGWSMKFFERRSTRLGPSTWRRIATSTLRTVDDAYWSAICKGGWKPAKGRLKNSRVLDSPILIGFLRTNDEADSVTAWTDNSKKRKTGLDIACPFVAALSDAGHGNAMD